MTAAEIAALVGTLLTSAQQLQQVAIAFNQANAEGRDITEAEKTAALTASQAAIDALAATLKVKP